MAKDEVPTDSYDSAAFGRSVGQQPGTGYHDRPSDERSTDRIGSASFRKNKGRSRPIGRYQVVSRLGAGATAEVFHARHVESGQEVALKVFSGQHHDYESLFREACAAVTIRHDNVIICHGIGEDRGRVYMAMELVTGGDVTGLVSRRGGLLPVPEALRLLIGCCHGLEAVAEAGFIHRDIKPSNIFLTEDGRPKLADLGLASSLLHDGTNQALAHMGTPAYMSPEQARGEELDIRSDLYALGATLYYMVTGRPPFQGTDPVEVVQAVLEREAPDPRAAVPGLNEDLVAVVLRCLRKDPSLRYPTPRELREDCQALLDGRRPMHQVARKETETRREALKETATEKPGTGSASRRLSEVRVRPSQIAVYSTLAVTVIVLLMISFWPEPQHYQQSRPGASETANVDVTARSLSSNALPATGLGVRWRQQDDRWQWQSHGEVRIEGNALLANGGYVSSRSEQVSRLLAAWAYTGAASFVMEIQDIDGFTRQPEPLLSIQQQDGSLVVSLVRIDDRLELRLATDDVSLSPQVFLSPVDFITDQAGDIAITIGSDSVTFFRDGLEVARFPWQASTGLASVTSEDSGFMAIGGTLADNGRFHGRIGRLVFFDYALSAEQLAEY